MSERKIDDVGGFTSGPWQWYGNTKFSYYLATTHSGRQHVMGFQRKGMQYAEPTFRSAQGMKVATHLAIFEVCPQAINQTDPRVYRQDIIGFRSADAMLIAAAPELYVALRAAMHALRSYQHHNASPELAEEVADLCERTLTSATWRAEPAS